MLLTLPRLTRNVTPVPDVGKQRRHGKAGRVHAPSFTHEGPESFSTSVQEYTQGFLESLNTQMRHFGNFLFLGNSQCRVTPIEWPIRKTLNGDTSIGYQDWG